MKYFGLVFLIFSLQPPLFAQGLGGGAPTTLAGDQRAIYEDIEIMRELLGRRLIGHHAVASQCALCHNVGTDPIRILAHNDMFAQPNAIHDVRSTGSRVANQSRDAHGAVISDFDSDGFADMWITNRSNPHDIPDVSVEGAYLKGQGIVFNVTLPAIPKASLEATTSEALPLKKSEWDQVRSQLRGENPEAPPKPKKVSLTDSLLQLVAENGKNFAHLSGNESLSIIVTFRPHSGMPFSQLAMNRAESSSSSSSGFKPSSGTMAMGGGQPMLGPGAGSGGPGMMGGGAGSAGGGNLTSSEPMTEDRELELLADLHLKRNNFSEAAAALERAVSKARSILLDPGLSADQAKLRVGQANARLRDLTRKLAEAYLKAGNLEAAKKALEQSPITISMDKSQSAAKPATTINVPSKLILTIPASALGQADSMSMADFKKLVSMQVLDFEQPRK